MDGGREREGGSEGREHMGDLGSHGNPETMHCGTHTQSIYSGKRERRGNKKAYMPLLSLDGYAHTAYGEGPGLLGVLTFMDFVIRS